MSTNEKLSDRTFALSHKVGVKLLNDEQLTNVFPDYNNLLNKIEIHRQAISGVQLDEKKHYQYNLMYDNVFSILGKRGTGKTSVAFTLKKKIEDNSKYCQDMVLPIIIPEVIPDDCSILGWILAVVKDEIIALEKEIKELQQNNEKNRQKTELWESCRYSEKNERDMLSERVDKLLELYFAGKYNPSNESSYYVAINNSTKQAENYYQFSKQIVKLWNEWVHKLKQYSLMKNTDIPADKVCPLIYFIFDDVDLSPQKVNELLSIIIKYLSHPNIMVITTADERLFLEVIENNMDKNIGRLPKEWRAFLTTKFLDRSAYYDDIIAEHQEEEGIIIQTARLYLGKVLPTSTRYYLRLFNHCEQKQWFKLDESTTLLEGVKSLIDELLSCMEDNRRTSNFIQPNSGKPINFYLYFFGITSRQIGNAYLSVQEFIKSLIKIMKPDSSESLKEYDYIDAVLSQCRHFLYSTIGANHELADEIEEIDEFVEEMLLNEYNQWRIYVNYPYLVNYLIKLKEEKYCNASEKLEQTSMQLFSLFFFMENVLLILESYRTITGRKHVHGISAMVNFICIHILKEKWVIRGDLPCDLFFEHYAGLLDRLHLLLENINNDKKFNIEYFYNFLDYKYEEKDIDLYRCSELARVSPKWFSDIVGRLFMVYGNAYLIGRRELEDVWLFKENNILSSYQLEMRQELKQSIADMFNNINMLNSARAVKNSLACLPVIEEKERRYHEFSSIILERIGGKAQDSFALVPLRKLFSSINNFMQDKDLEYVVRLADESYRLAIKEENGVVQLIQEISRKIEQWDLKPHRLCIEDNEQLNDRFTKLSEFKNGSYSEKVMDIVKQMSRTSRFSSSNSNLYRQTKELLEQISEDIIKAKEITLLGEPYDYYSILEDILTKIDIGVDRNNDKEVQEAIAVGYQFQLLKRLQKIYFSLIICDKYDNKYEMSSTGLEIATVIEGKGKKKAKENPAYYYKLYKLLYDFAQDQIERTAKREKKFSQKNKKEMEKTFSFLNMFVAKAVRNAKRSYLNELFNGVQNE